MIRVKYSSRGGVAAPDLSQFTGNRDNTWGDCQFHVNDGIERADVWFVSEDVDDEDRACLVAPERVIFLSAETSWEPGRYAPDTLADKFLDQFAHVYSCHDVYRDNVVSSPPFLPWMINANHGPSITAPHQRNLRYFAELQYIPKTRDLSVFCSAQTLTANHRMRLRFVEALKTHFQDRLDWYGNGINPLPEKWSGIAPYRYTLAIENQSADNVFSEKIMDAFLGLAYPIYWGAPNLANYFPAESFAPVNIRDLNGSIQIIEDLLSSDRAESQMKTIIQAKELVLWKYNLFARLASIAQHVVATTPHSEPQLVELWSLWRTEVDRVRADPIAKLGRKMMGAGRRLSASH